MTFVRTLVLVVAAAALGSYMWLVELPNMQEEARADLLLDIDPAAVQRVRLAYPDGTTIEAVRESGGWNLVSPVAYPAENSVLDGFLNTVHETKIERRLAADEAGPLANYGLEGETGSQARLEITTNDGRTLPAVILGGTTPVGYQAFARRDGSGDVLVIPLLLQSSAKKSPDDVRRKAMFPGNAADARHVTIEKPDGTIELDRGENGDWTMSSPLHDEADAQAVSSMLDSLSTIDALAFYDGDKADRDAFGLTDAATHFVAERGDEGRIEFRIGKSAEDPPAGSYFERLSDGQVVKVPDWVVKKFAPAANELRQRRLVFCDAEDVLQLAWSSPSGAFTISREAAGKPWRIAPENEKEALNQRVVDNALRTLVLARADEVVGDASTQADLSRWGLDAPEATLDIDGKDGRCASLIGAAAQAPAGQQGPAGSGRLYYLKNAGRTAVLRASEHEYSRISMKRSEFVDDVPDAQAAPDATPPS